MGCAWGVSSAYRPTARACHLMLAKTDRPSAATEMSILDVLGARFDDRARPQCTMFRSFN